MKYVNRQLFMGVLQMESLDQDHFANPPEINEFIPLANGMIIKKDFNFQITLNPLVSFL